MSGTLRVKITALGDRWTWAILDTNGIVGISAYSRAELRQVQRDLSLLLGCELEPRKQGGRIVGYYPIGRSENVLVEVKR